MIIPLILALGVFVFIFYTCCYSPPAQRIADEIFYDPLEDSIRRDAARMGSQEEQSFFHERVREYLKDEYDDDFIGNREGRTRTVWARDKAFDDMINMDEVRESLEAAR